jgi:hypothetical protein
MRAIALLVVFCSLSASAAPAKSAPTKGAPSSAGALPPSIANRLRQMGCKGDDFKLVMCARPQMNNMCRNWYTDALGCNNRDLASRAQECLDNTGTDAPIYKGLQTFDAAYAAYTKRSKGCEKPGAVQAGPSGSCARLAGANKTPPCTIVQDVRIMEDIAQLKSLSQAATNESTTCKGYYAKKMMAAAEESAARGLTALAKMRQVCANIALRTSKSEMAEVQCQGWCTQLAAHKQSAQAICASKPESEKCRSLRAKVQQTTNKMKDKCWCTNS